MSSERETVLNDIEDNKADLREVKKELGKTLDPAKREKLENRRDRLEETIGTLEKTRLALTPLPAGKKASSFHHSSFFTLFVVFSCLLLSCIM